MAAIFICYRREDSLSATGRLADALVSQFGADRIFRDIEGIEIGDDFTRVIEHQIRNATVFLVVIGHRWGELRNPRGTLRLEEHTDHVRREIELAMTAKVPIIPILVEGASPPMASALPHAIASIAKLNALQLVDPHWNTSFNELVIKLWHDHEIEPIRYPKDVPPNTFLAVMRRFPIHLATLVLNPKRFLATRVYARNRSVVEGLIFFSLSTLIAGWLLIEEWPGRSFLMYSATLVMSAIITVVISIPLYFAWRLVGAGRHYGRIVTILLYQLSVVYLVYGFLTLMIIGSANVTNPEIPEAIRQTI